MTLCAHTAAIFEVPPPRDGCETCLEIGGTWFHLRQCLTCGVTLCCDSSPNRHMSGHGEATGHPIISGVSPGEGWTWCRADEAMIREVPEGWEPYDPFVEAGTWHAARYVEGGGSVAVEEGFATPDGFPLGAWRAYVRDLHAAGTLELRDAAAIEDLPGWQW